MWWHNVPHALRQEKWLLISPLTILSYYNEIPFFCVTICIYYTSLITSYFPRFLSVVGVKSKKISKISFCSFMKEVICCMFLSTYYLCKFKYNFSYETVCISQIKTVNVLWAPHPSFYILHCFYNYIHIFCYRITEILEETVKIILITCDQTCLEIPCAKSCVGEDRTVKYW